MYSRNVSFIDALRRERVLRTGTPGLEPANWDSRRGLSF